MTKKIAKLIHKPKVQQKKTNTYICKSCENKNAHVNPESHIYYLSADQFNTLRGLEFDAVWIDELCTFRYPKELLAQVDLCLRRGNSKMIITTTPSHNPALYELMQRPGVVVTKGHSLDNPHLSTVFQNNISYIENKSWFEQEIAGNLNVSQKLDFVYGVEPKFEKYYIGIDPAVSVGCTGIIIAGYAKKKFYILEDLSTTDHNFHLLIFDTIKNYQSLGPMIINIESNQGGQMWKGLFAKHHININCIFTKLSKLERLDILQQAYIKEKIIHTTKFHTLEYDLEYHRTSDRVDALFYATIYNDPQPILFGINYGPN